jgi:hypothetical protein
VVVDRTGKRRYRFDAMVFMVGASPFLRPFAGLLAWKPVFKLGDWFYRNVANNRLRMGFLAGLLHFRDQSTRQSLAGKILAGTLIALALAWNLQAIRAFELPGPAREAVLALRLDQDWPKAFAKGGL